MKKIVLVFLIATGWMFQSCSESLEPQETNFGLVGEITVRGYVISETDSIQVLANDKNLSINDKIVFTKAVQTEYQFVSYYTIPSQKKFKIVNSRTNEVVLTKDYDFNNAGNTPQDTLSFFYKPPSILIEDVLSFNPGTLTQSGYVGYRFIFPNLNYYSNSGYTGTVDAILTRFPNGEAIGTVENIGTDTFSDFIEFPFTAPPAPPIAIITVKLVKHGTTESYLPSGTPVTIEMNIQTGKSKLIVLEEVAGNDGNFSKVTGSVDLTVYFSY